jgi:long-chain acyl-CoA synthetase
MASFNETSMAAIFQAQAERFSYRGYASHKKDGKWVDITWNEMREMVHQLAFFLIFSGVSKGDRVGLFAANGWQWHLTALAINSIGAVDVPIYSTNSSEEAHYILENAQVKLCFTGSFDQMEKVHSGISTLPLLEKVVVFQEGGNLPENVMTLSQALAIGKANPYKKLFSHRINNIAGSDLCTILYTSGTTGKPKGVMLTHDNYVSNIRNTMNEMVDRETGEDLFSPDDVMLSFLPLSHSLERTAGFHGAIWGGVKTAFAEDISKLLENLIEVKPTIIISVPRIYEKVHAGILAKVSGASAIKKGIFNFAMNQAQRALPTICRDEVPGNMAYKIADKMVYSGLKKALGMDRLKAAISGGAPLSIADGEFFIGMGIIIMEGYGLSETTPILTFNRNWHIKPGTVGMAIPETDIRIADDGEIQVRGPQVMPGYYRNENDTNEAFTEDGYFRTGDIGIIDDDGHLSITGRIKDIIVTAGGKNISPQNLENSLKASSFIEQVGVIGDKRKFLSALIVPAFAEVESWARNQGISFSTHDELILHPDVISLFRSEVDKNTAEYARVEQIRKFTLLNGEWTQESGELTPTQKVKRKVVNEKYVREIEAMYEEQ